MCYYAYFTLLCGHDIAVIDGEYCSSRLVNAYGEHIMRGMDCPKLLTEWLGLCEGVCFECGEPEILEDVRARDV